MKSISIVMATYNGAKYLKDQLDSIVPFLNSCDEIIISDDGSKDGTKEIIDYYVTKYHNISVVEGPMQGLIRNFENAISYASKDIVMFSDQDDIWLPEKIPTIRQVFDSNQFIEVVLHDKFICDNSQISMNEFGPFLHESDRWRHGVLRNIFFSCYFGCCMAMRRSFIQSIIPFPKNTIAYDQLVGAIAEHRETALFIKMPLIVRRVHGENQTRKRGFIEKILFRIKNICAYYESIRRMK